MSGLNRKLMTGIWVVAALMLAACAGPWQAAPDRLEAPLWVIESPEGWMHLSTRESDMLSKDGPYLEYILIQSKSLDRGFRNTNQKIDADMLPHEVAQLITDNMRSDPLIRQFRLLASEPVEVDGHPGFRLTYSYLDQFGVALKTIYYGVVLPDLFFNLRYTGAQRYYFDKELPAFDKALHSLRFIPE